MKVLVEAMCAQFGGIRTYVEHLLRVWPDEFPDDEVHVMLRADSDLPLGPNLVRHDVEVYKPAALGRPLAQSLHLPKLAKRLGVDAVLATSASTSVRRVSVPMGLVHYDLRHELRPEQFSWQRRLLRAVSYRRGYAVADGIISISQRSLDDLHRLHPNTTRLPSVVAHLGADHVDEWGSVTMSGPVLTFAHHTNKNLDLSLQGWKVLLERRPDARLLVLGLGGAERADVSTRLHDLGLTHSVELAPFLSDQEFQRHFAAARLILFPSDFEGFGLPVAEGLRLGVPVVIGPEIATQEVASGHAEVMQDWSAGALASAADRALDWSPERRAAAQAHAARYTWANTAKHTRKLLHHIAPEARSTA